MTEPRDPAAPEEDAVPEPNPWYPVGTQAEPVPEEAGVEQVAEEAGVEPVAEVTPAAPSADVAPEEADAEPVAEAVAEEPSADVAPEEADAEPVAEAIPEEPGADVAPEEADAEPVAEAIPEEPSADVAPEEADAEPVAEAVSEEPSGDAAQEADAEPVADDVSEEPSGDAAQEADAEPVADDVSEEPSAEPVPEEAGEDGAVPDEVPSVPQDAESTVVIDTTADDATAPVFATPENTATQRLTLVVPEETLVVPEATVPVPVAPADAIFRPPSPATPGSEPTRIEQLSQEEERLAAERAARRDARVAAFAAPVPQPVVAPAPVVVQKRTNDGFWGSLGLFLLRILLAGVFALRGLYTLTDLAAAEEQIAKTVLADVPPGPPVWAIILGVSSLLIALSLLLGLLTRVAGLGIALIAGGALVLVYWGPWSPFLPGQPGFLGEYELLLTVVGLLLLFLGGGGWSLDRSFRAGRELSKRERSDTSD